MLKVNVIKEQTYKCKGGTYDASRISLIGVFPPIKIVNTGGKDVITEHPDNNRVFITFEGRQNVNRWLHTNKYVPLPDGLWGTEEELVVRGD